MMHFCREKTQQSPKQVAEGILDTSYLNDLDGPGIALDSLEVVLGNDDRFKPQFLCLDHSLLTPGDLAYLARQSHLASKTHCSVDCHIDIG